MILGIRTKQFTNLADLPIKKIEKFPPSNKKNRNTKTIWCKLHFKSDLDI